MDQILKNVVDEFLKGEKDEFAVMHWALDFERQTNLVRPQIHRVFDTRVPFTENRPGLIVTSNQLREQGNKLFKAAPKDNSLAACRFYTKAIFSAPLGESLALAHANRGAALLEFGYLQQAYDDCECALELGYPEKLRQKIWMRQAVCAQGLGDVMRLKQHLDVLGAQHLNAKFIEPFEKLKKDLQKMLETVEDTTEPNRGCAKVTDLHRETQKIIKTDQKERYMVATEPISKQALIFKEELVSFVPLSDSCVCHQCATTLLIPFPCYQCQGKVVYCSLKCRRAHQPIHSIECLCYQRNFFSELQATAHLAFRLVIEHFPQVAGMLRYMPTAKQIWRELTEEDGLVQRSGVPYSQALRMVTHLRKKTFVDIIVVAGNSHILVEYLNQKTNFFDMNVFKGTKVTRDDWKLITGALIQRHIGQLVSNTVQCCFIRRESSHSLDFGLLGDKLWEKPWHVKCGFLHQFSSTGPGAVAIFPYRQLCRHSCESSFDTKYSGRFISTLASKSIRAGEQIFDSYYFDYRTTDRKSRLSYLKHVHYFKCKCLHCTKNPQAEENCELFHQLRCEKTDCHKIFTCFKLFKQNENMWEVQNAWTEFKCSHCNKVQSSFFKLQLKISELVLRNLELRNPAQRHKLYRCYEALDDHLLGFNFIKIAWSSIIVETCNLVDFGCSLSNAEIIKLTKIIKFSLRGMRAMFGSNSLQYVSSMVHLWDFIALEKYKPNGDEMNEMLQALKIVSDEMQQVFKNYYNDFIITKYKS